MKPLKKTAVMVFMIRYGCKPQFAVWLQLPIKASGQSSEMYG
jgi:hypothetical protein